MTLRTIAIPNPPPGFDWTYVVPGNYLLDVRSVIATLDTHGVAFHYSLFNYDASSNGNDGLLTGATKVLVDAAIQQAGAMSGSKAIALATMNGLNPPAIDVNRSTRTSMDWSGNWTFECWVKHVAPYFGGPAFNFLGAVADPFDLSLDIFLDVIFTRGTDPNPYAAPATIWPNDGAWHLLTIPFDLAANQKFYIDGVSINASSQTAPGSRNAVAPDDIGYEFFIFPSSECYIDNLAVYPRALSGAEIAAHYAAAAGGEPGYSNLIRSAAPSMYFLFDETAADDARFAALSITNGFIQVQRYGASGPQGDAATVTYSWLASLNSPSDVSSTQTQAVAIPDLILPAGYTIGTDTSILAPTDQWSNITIWWDDALQQSVDAVAVHDYPPGAFLEYQQREG